MTELVIALGIAALIGFGGLFGYLAAREQNCYEVCRAENALRKEFADHFKACGYAGIDAHPDLTQCVCR